MLQRFRYVLAGWLLVTAAGVNAEGRYQAIPIDPAQGYGAEKALILDTVSGHLWIWIESPAVDDEPGGRFLIYQGQLVPGKTMGDIIDQQAWPAKPRDKDADAKGLGASRAVKEPRDPGHTALP